MQDVAGTLGKLPLLESASRHLRNGTELKKCHTLPINRADDDEHAEENQSVCDDHQTKCVSACVDQNITCKHHRKTPPACSQTILHTSERDSEITSNRSSEQTIGTRDVSSSGLETLHKDAYINQPPSLGSATLQGTISMCEVEVAEKPETHPCEIEKNEAETTADLKRVSKGATHCQNVSDVEDKKATENGQCLFSNTTTPLVPEGDSRDCHVGVSEDLAQSQQTSRQSQDVRIAMLSKDCQEHDTACICPKRQLPDHHCCACCPRVEASNRKSYPCFKDADPVPIIGLVVMVATIVLYLVDLATDIRIAVVYYQYANKDPRYLPWARLTAALVVVPALIMTLYSISILRGQYEWSRISAPASKGHLVVIVTMHLALQGLFYRMLLTMYLAIKARKDPSYRRKMLAHDTQQRLIGLLEPFAECLPQLFLQLYIATQVSEEESTEIYVARVACALSSWLSIAVALPLLARSRRTARHTEGEGAILELTVLVPMILWRLFMVGSRIVAMVVITTVAHLYILPFVIFHCVAMIIWQMSQKLHFCRDLREINDCLSLPQYLLKVFFDYILVSYILLFDLFLYFPDGDSENKKNNRSKLAFYYPVYFIENSVMVVVWFCFTRGQALWYRWPVLVGVHISFFLGLACLVMYYTCCHPNRKCDRHGVKSR